MDSQFDNEKLRELIKTSGYRPDFVADNLGIKPTSLRMIMCGSSRPSLSVIKLMSIFFKVPESDLYKKAA